MKTLTVNEYRTALRIAQAIDPNRTKREAVAEKLAKLQEEYQYYANMVSKLEQGFVSEIGLHVEQIIQKVIEPGIDVNGKPKKTTKFIPTPNVRYDSDAKLYYVTEESNMVPAGGAEEEAPEVDTDEAGDTTDSPTPVSEVEVQLGDNSAPFEN